MSRPLPVALVVLFAGTMLSGCVLSDSGEVWDCTQFEEGPELYRYRYPGDDAAVAGGTYGWAVLATNPYDEYLLLELAPDVPGTWQGGLFVSWNGEPVAYDVRSTTYMQGHARSLWYFTTTLPADLPPGNVTFSLDVASSMWTHNENRSVWDTDSGFCEIEVQGVDTWDVRILPDATPVRPGDKVTTYTAGLWTNGTSFYTNIKALNDDPDFPAGYDRTAFGGDPLPVYVYDEQGSEQPVGHRDRCGAVTITGYNTLLKTQHEGTTNLRLLAPEEAYTLPGREDFFLYGHSLLFINTIATHEGPATQEDETPDPTGACFDHRNSCRKEPSIAGPCAQYVPPPPDVPRAER